STSVQFFSGGGEQCAHPICQTGAALDASCDPCAADLCAQDPYCCNTEWDATCVGEVTAICGQSCTAARHEDPEPSTCSHPICATGIALASTCESCTAELCEHDPYCCTVMW